MRVIGLSGWLQPAESLKGLTLEMEMFDYSAYPNIAEASVALAALQPDIVIGWSLGGVVTVQALAQPNYRPTKLILLGAAYQFIASAAVPEACKPAEAQALRDQYSADPQAFAKRLQLMLMYGAKMESPSCPLSKNITETARWLPWLDHLAASSFEGFVPPYQPEVLVVHGAADIVIPAAQAKYWSRIFPQVQVMILPEVSHAPHVQAPEWVQRTVLEFMENPKVCNAHTARC